MREEMTTLGESCQFFNGKAHEKVIDAEGQFVVVNSKFISQEGRVLKFTGKQMFPLYEDDIVMVMSDVPNGKALAKCYIIEENDKYSLNQRICAIRTTEFNIRFLYYQLNRHPYLLAFNNGENQTNLRKGDILNCPLWKPPLDIQEQIVELLDETLEQVNSAESNIVSNINNTEKLFQSKLNELFENEDEDWDTKTFKEVCSVITDGTHQTPKYFDSGYIFLSSKNVTTGKIDWENIKYIDEAQHLKMYKRLKPQKNDILLAKNGTTGVAAIVDVDKVFDIYVSLALLRPTETIYPYYFLHFINSLKAKKQFNKRLIGVGVPNLHLKEIKEVVISFPKSIDEQVKIANYIDELIEFRDSLKDTYQNKLENVRELREAIFQKAFTGRIINQEQSITV
jgi:type I restriction enzyme S subunit